MRIFERVLQQFDDGGEQHRAIPLNSQLPADRQDLRPASFAIAANDAVGPNSATNSASENRSLP